MIMDRKMMSFFLGAFVLMYILIKRQIKGVVLRTNLETTDEYDQEG